MKDVIEGVLPSVRRDLEELVRIPSVSAYDPQSTRESALKTFELLEAEGLQTELLEIDGAHPAVLATHPAPFGAPTVLLYAHHDVQPPGDESKWLSKPFEPVERDGRLYGRGTADDKGGIAMHLAALRAFQGNPPVGVTVFIEGEEETGSEHLIPFLERYGDQLSGDVVVLADSTNWRVGEPALTTSLRGLVDCIVEVRTLDHAIHSGMYGGPIPDALSALCRVLATLHDEKGNVAVGNRVVAHAKALDLTEQELREQAGVKQGVSMIGEGSLTERIWNKPALSVLGIDAPTVHDASNQLVPVARAKVSMRLAPGDDPSRALDELEEHLERNAPWGANVTVTRGAAGRPYALDATGPVYQTAREAMREAWDGASPVDIGVGGSIPFVAAFADAYPNAAILLTGVEDPDTRAHGENESLHLNEFRRACLAEALLLQKLGAPST
ncbi:MAG: M20/M25/M40 family metallo-hydrolase [Actinomycetota bacterium]